MEEENAANFRGVFFLIFLDALAFFLRAKGKYVIFFWKMMMPVGNSGRRVTKEKK